MKHAFKRIMALALVIAMMIGVLPSVFSANVAGFTDVKDDAWYAKYVEYVVFQDLMIGTSTNTFEPESPLTRAMTATVLWRMAGEPPFYNKSTFTDLTEDWYMNAVAWAQSKKIVNGVTTTTFEPDTFATREQIVAMLWRYAGSPKAEGDYLKDYTDAASISSYAKDAFNWAISVGIINGWRHKLTPRDNATRAEFAKMIYQYAEITKPCTHTWDGGKVTKEATCTEAGEMLYTCTKCGETKIAPIPAKGHHYGDDGKCTDCGAEKPVDPTEPTTPTEPDESTVVENVVIYYPKESKVMTTEEYAYTSPKTSKTKLELASAGATLADGKVTTSATNAAVFTMTTTKDDIVTFKTKDGKFLYVDGTDVKLVAEEGECTKFVLEDTEGGKFIRCATKEYNGKPQYLEFYGGYFTTFGMGEDTSIYTFGIYPIATGDTPTPPTPSTDEYVLTNELKDGDEVVIYNPGNGKALAGEMSRYYVAGADVTPENDKITGPEAKLVWTVKKNADGSYTFTQDGGKTLGVSSSESNGKTYYNLYIDGEHDATWTVEALNAENKLFKIYSATMTGSYGNVYVEWYAKNTAFSAYDAGADKVTEKDFGFQFYVKGGETPEPCEHVWGEGVETTLATCTEAGVKTYTCSKCGETKTEPIPALGHNYVNGTCTRCGATEPAGETFERVTSNLTDWSGTYLIADEKDSSTARVFSGVDAYQNYVTATIADNKIVKDEAMTAPTVTIAAIDGGYSIKVGDKYMGANNNKNSLVINDTAILNTIQWDKDTNKVKIVSGINGDTGEVTLRYNTVTGDKGDRFRYYKSNEGNNKFPLVSLYKLTDGGETPHVHTWDDGKVTTEPTCTEAGVKTYTCSKCDETKTEPIPALGHNYVNGVCSRCGATEPVLPEYVLATELKDGDEVVVYNPGNGKAIAGEMSSYYVAGVAVTPDDNKLTDPAAKLIWTVKKNADGSYTFTQDGDKIFGTSPRENNGQTYYNLYIDGEHDTTWTIEALNAESKLFKIYSATLTGSHGNVYVEWYAKKTAFSAYDTSADKVTEKDFGFQFYVKKTAEEPVKDITVYFTNDVHGAYELYPYAATAMKGADLIVDAGDNIQGSVATTLTNGQCMVDLMKTVGYDVAVPGNHEFDYGFDRFLEIVNGDNTPYVSANLWDKTADKAVLDAYKMFTVNGKKVAIVGITTPETLVKSTPTFFQNDKGEYIYDFCNDETGEKLYKVVQTAVDAAKTEGADYVIAVGHLGIDEQSEPWTSTSVIKNTSGIDALIDGHSHSTFSNTQKNKDGKDVVVAQTGTKLANVGKLTIAADGTITAVNIPLYEVKTRVNPDTGKEEKYNDYLFEEDEKIAAEVAKVKEEVDKVSEKVVARTEVDLTTLDPETGKRAVRSAETNLGDLCADAYRDLLGTDIAFVNGGGVRADIEKGDITYGQIIAVHPFGNTACKIEVTGEQIWTALEIGAAANPGESGGFLQVSGLEYTINTYIPTPARFDEKKNFVKLEGEHRVTDVKIGGQPLDVNKTYTLGGHNYMLIDGGDGFTVFKGSKILAQEVAIDNEVLIKYIRDTLNGVVAADSVYANPTGAGRITIKIAPVEVSSTHRDGVKIPTYVTLPEDYGMLDRYPLVVMLHGHGGNHNEWGGYDAISNGLAAKGAVVVTLDFPGCGTSTEGFERNTLTNMKDDVLDVINYMAEHYQIDNARIGGFGYSMGGRILLEMLAEETGSFSAIELVAPGEDANDLKQMFVRAEDNHTSWDDMKAEAEKNGYYNFNGGYWTNQHLSKEWFADYEKYPDGLVEKAAEKYAGTALVIWATDDTTIAPSVSANTAAVLNSATVNTYKEGHSYSFYGKDEYTVSTVNNASIGYFVNELITEHEGINGYVQSISKYGNMGLTISGAELKNAGYEYGDILKITVDGKELSVPYGTNYSDVDQGKTVLTNVDNYLTLAINMGNFATVNGFATKNSSNEWYYTTGVGLPVTVKIEMGEKGGYYDEWINHQLKRTNDRDDYKNLSDAEFANFRQITTTGMGDHLYRGSSPINPEIVRNTYADAALKDAKATVIMNLADDETTAKAYEGFASTYYAGQKVIYLNLGVDFTAKDFQDGLAKGLKFFAANEGVYYVHCTEGKDRCGFVSALLECLMGATADEVVSDYMVTYYNYYGVDKTTDAKKYESIANSNIIKTLKTAFEVDDLTTADLAAEAEAYIKSIGLTDAEITNLKANLANKTEGHTHTYGAPTYTWSADYSYCTAKVVCSDTECPVEEGRELTEKSENVTSAMNEGYRCTADEGGTKTYTATFIDTAHFAPTVETKVNVPKKAKHSYDALGECTACGAWDFDANFALYYAPKNLVVSDEKYSYEDGTIALDGQEAEFDKDGLVVDFDLSNRFNILTDWDYTFSYRTSHNSSSLYTDGKTLKVISTSSMSSYLGDTAEFEANPERVYFYIDHVDDGVLIRFKYVKTEAGEDLYVKYDGEGHFTVGPMDVEHKTDYIFQFKPFGHEHLFDFADHGKVTKEATCTEEGERLLTCESEGCTKTITKKIRKLDHKANAEGNCSACGQGVYDATSSTPPMFEGTEVIIYSPAGKKALSSVAGDGTAVDVPEDALYESGWTIVTGDTSAVWKVEWSVDGYQLVNKDGKTLSITADGLGFAETDNNWSTLRATWEEISWGKYILTNGTKALKWDTENEKFIVADYNDSHDTEFAVCLYIKAVKADTHKHDYKVTFQWAEDYSSCKALQCCKVAGCKDYDNYNAKRIIVGESTATCTTPGTHTVTAIFGLSSFRDPTVTVDDPAQHNVNKTTGVCNTCGKTIYKLADALYEGDEVIIYNPASGKAMSQEAVATKYRAGADVTPEVNAITTDDAKIIWTVKRTIDGYQFVNANGETLSATDGLSFAATDNTWTLTAGKTAGTYIISSTTAKGKSGDPKAIEWYKDYSEFSTFYYSEDSADIFEMQLYVKAIEVEHTADHVYSVTYRWADDHSAFYTFDSCTTPGCHRTAQGTINEKGITTETKDPTCTEPGKTVYKVSYWDGKGTAEATDTVIDADKPALGHNYNPTTNICTRCNEPKPLDPPVSSTRYEKVTTTPTDADSKTDWTGTYLIVYEASDTEGYVFNGLDEAGNKIDVTITSSTISSSNDVKACEITVAKCDGGYSFRLTGGKNPGKYLAAKAGKNKIIFSDTAKALTITLHDSTVEIKDGDAPFQYNNGTNNGQWFRFFGKNNGGQKDITLYKLVTK